MPPCLEPRFEVLPAAQRHLWPNLAPARRLSYVLYGGTAVALHLGHRQSVDFDFFRSPRLDKVELRKEFSFIPDASILQDSIDTLVVSAGTPHGPVKVSFFGGVGLGRVNEPLRTCDGTLLVASLDDLLATKLKTILDRAEARDYKDIADMLRAGIALPHALSAFQQMFGGEPATVLRAIGYFDDGNLPTLGEADRSRLREARDLVRDLPSVWISRGDLAGSAAVRD